MHFCLDDSPRFKMIELDTTDSTNTFLCNYQNPSHVPIVLATADYQTGGRGQAGNSWESERGSNLLFSILISNSSVPASQLFSISEAISLSLSSAIAEHLREALPASQALPPISVKWPNDIYIADSKVAGILIETELQGSHIKRAIIGVGLNVNQLQFKSDAPNPVSLRQVCGSVMERQLVLASVMGHFCHWNEQLLRGDYTSLHTAYRRHLYRGEPGTFWPFADSDGAFMATITDVEPDGHLLLTDPSGRQRRYAFKEVSFTLHIPARPQPPTSRIPG